jgi:Kef-type K+ transport system membrane component KefB
VPLAFELEALATIGVSIAAAFLIGQVFRRIGIPQVVGFIVAGVLLGPSFLHLIPEELNHSLTFVSSIALGLIGFDMGGHLRFDELRALGRSILLIVLFEAFGAFVLVGVGVLALTRSLPTALIFAALSSATAPAATVDVLAEYHAAGPLTTTLLAVVGLDDALSLLLYSVMAAVAESTLTAGGDLSVVGVLELPFFEIGGSFAAGIIFGLLLNLAMRRFHLLAREADAIVLPIGVVFICAGLSQVLGLSLILTTMTLGLVVVNREPDHGRYVRSTIEQAGPVIYVLFFVLAGARFRVSDLPVMGWLGAAYIALRTTGKYLGAWTGGGLGGASPAVRNNLGLALLSQAGVALGLALESQHRFSALGAEGAAFGGLILSVITATTLVVQLVGPVGVKLAITRAGEVGGALETLFAD